MNAPRRVRRSTPTTPPVPLFESAAIRELGLLRVGHEPHRAELQHLEPLAVPSDALRTVENRPPRGEVNADGQRGHDGREEHESSGRRRPGRSRASPQTASPSDRAHGSRREGGRREEPPSTARSAFSYSLGTNEVRTPSCSHRSSTRSRTSSGAVEKVTTTCSIPYSSMIRSRSQLAPRTGSPTSSEGRRGSLSRNPTGSSPISGCSRSREAVSRPTFPAPTIRVGWPASPARLARRSESMSEEANGDEQDGREDPQAHGLGRRPTMCRRGSSERR